VTGFGVSLRISAMTARAVTARVGLSKTTTSESLTITTELVEVQTKINISGSARSSFCR